MQSLRFRIGTLLLVLLVLLLAACAPQAVPAAPSGSTGAETSSIEEATTETSETVPSLRIAILSDESTLTPFTYVSGYPGWNILTLQYDTLYQLDATGAPQPWLVSATEISEDGLTYTLDLVEGVTWHDGEAFTAEDVKFTFDYFAANNHSRFTRAVRPIASTEVEGDNRVIITLADVTPSFGLSVLADVPIIPQHIWSGVENPAEYIFDDVTNVGTGPYKLVEYVAEQYYRFEANTDYFAGVPNIQELVFVKFADDAGTLAALRSGEVDMLIRPVAPEQIDLLVAQSTFQVQQGPLYTTQMLIYNLDRPIFNSLAVRQAMALAIDRQDLIDTVYLGAATLGNLGWIHPASPYYNADIAYVYDPEQAIAVLEEAGIVDSDGDGVRELDGEPISFDFLVNGSDSLRLRLAELVSQMLAEVGIKANVIAAERTTWEESVWPNFDVANGRNYDMAVWGWSAPVQADPGRFPNLVHSDPAIGTSNLSGYVSAEADALSEAIMVEGDEAKRTELVKELQTLVATDLPFLLLLYPDGAYAYNADKYDGWIFMTGQGVFHKLSLLPEAAQP